MYLTAPALAILVKFEIYNNLVGMPFVDLPSWVSAWSAVDRSLISILDLNQDGIVNAADLMILLTGWDTPSADIDGNGTTNAQDLTALLNVWGAC